jgi:excisionase family DNA binding protein
MSDLLTVDEAATRLRCSRRRVFELLADGTLQRGPKYGKQTVITAESVAAALAAPPASENPAPPAKPRAARGLAADVDALLDARRAARRKRR